MEKLIAIVLSCGLIVFVIARGVTFWSGKAPAPSREGARLAPCPDKPNCVSSETGEMSTHFVEPLPLGDGEPAAALAAMRAAVEKTGGTVTEEDELGFNARYLSLFMSYVDDFQVRLDLEDKAIHLRSASRLGHSDFGKNRARVEQVKQAFRQSTEAA